MKHKIEIAPNLAIYIDGERVIGSKPYGLFLTTVMTVSDDDLKRLADRCLEVISDRKTKNCSEKPNNCETCRHYKLACELFSEICKYEPKDEPLTADYCDTCDHKECEYCIADSSNPYCVPSNYHKVEDESTISKMEQVEQRSCDTCKNRDIEGWKNPCLGCTEFTFYEPKDEPQTCSFSDCDNFKNPDYERCIECKRKQIKLKTEQTERSE